MRFSVWFCSAILLAARPAFAVTEADLDKMQSSAAMLGQAIGCKIDVKSASGGVNRWMDEKFPVGSADNDNYGFRFGETLQRAQEYQTSHADADSCAKVKAAFDAFDWPKSP